MQAHYQQLIDLTHQVVHQAQQVQQHLETHKQQSERLAQRRATTLQTVVARVAQVIAQTTRRGIQNEAVSAGDTLVSLCEPHTAIIRKGKAGKPIDSERVVWPGDVAGGIMTQARVLDGNSDDTAEVGAKSGSAGAAVWPSAESPRR